MTEQRNDLWARGVAAHEAGDLEQARRLLEGALSLEDANGRLWLALASVLQGAHEHLPCIAAAERAMEIEPGCAWLAHTVAGQCWRDLGELSEAERCFRASLGERPDPGTAVFLSMTLDRQGRHAESRDCLLEAISLDPCYEEAHYNLACGYKLEGKRDAAEPHLRRAIELDPSYVRAHAELGCLLGQQGDLVGSEKHLRTSIALDARYPWARIYLAQLLWQLDRLDEARAEYETALALWPDNAISHWVLADFLACTSQEREEAERLFARSVELDPGSSAAHHAYGKALLRWRKHRRARDALRRAARLGDTRASRLLESLCLPAPPEQ
jgi:protein O-GlcNAc transferase